MLIDVDGFKTINDDLGHTAGDRALRQVADCLRCHARDVDFLARFGGDEFLMLLPNTYERAVQNVAQRIRIEVETIGRSEGDRELTLSIGTATARPTADEPNLLIEWADAALYRAKDHGRDQVAAHEPALR